jgi:hypothetical protein
MRTLERSKRGEDSNWRDGEFLARARWCQDYFKTFLMYKKAYATLSPCTNGQALLISEQLYRQQNIFITEIFSAPAQEKTFASSSDRQS